MKTIAIVAALLALAACSHTSTYSPAPAGSGAADGWVKDPPCNRQPNHVCR